MTRLITIVVLSQLLFKIVVSQSANIKSTVSRKEESLVKQPGSRVDSLIKGAAAYIYKTGENEKDLVASRHLLELAISLSKQHRYVQREKQAVFLLARSYIESKQPEEVKPLLSWFADSLLMQLQTDLAWCYFNRRKDQRDYDSAAFYGEKASTYLRTVKPTDSYVEMLRMIAQAFYYRKNYQKSEEVLLEAAAINKTMGGQKLPMIYNVLSSISSDKGNYNNALYYSMEAVKQVHKTGNIEYAGSLHYILGSVYSNTGDFTKALLSYDSAITYYRKQKDGAGNARALRQMQAGMLTKLHREAQALELLNKTIIEFPPRSRSDSNGLFNSFGDVYFSVNDFRNAERMYLLASLPRDGNPALTSEQMYNLSKLYIEWNRFEKIGGMLDSLYKNEYPRYSARTKAHFRFMMYKVDSARGNYLAAIQHLMVNKKLDDSVITEAKNKEISSLNVRYDTDKKDQELTLNTQNILLLKRQSDLQTRALENTRLQLALKENERMRIEALSGAETQRKNDSLLLAQTRIERLQQQSELQQSNLEGARFTRNIIIAGLALLLVLIFLIYGRYRFQQRTNKQLQLQQKIINDKNNQLSKLVMEKEWLLTEVHHRVKNNLHTIFSLLESQSAFLENDALAAILNSQHRVYAMSLIHQKLYQSGTMTKIPMNEYLRELIVYLSESFDIVNKVHFEVAIDALDFDVSIAVPVGLIVNEAITNSYKYAFANTELPIVKVSLERKSNHSTEVTLIVTDNGIGIPGNFDADNSNSLGIKLIRGLADDLNGNFRIYNSGGTKLEISFDMAIATDMRT